MPYRGSQVTLLTCCALTLLGGVSEAMDAKGKLVEKGRGCVLLEPKTQVVRRYEVSDGGRRQSTSCALACTADGRHLVHVCSGNLYNYESGPSLTRSQCTGIYGSDGGSHCSDRCRMHKRNVRVTCTKVISRGAERLKCIFSHNGWAIQSMTEPDVRPMSPCGYKQQLNVNETSSYTFGHGQQVLFYRSRSRILRGSLPKLQAKQQRTSCTCLDGNWLKSQAPRSKEVAKPCKAILDKTGAASSKWRPIQVETATLCP